MKSFFRIISIFGFLLVPILVLAVPGIPHQFYGTVKYTNGNSVSGTVNAKIGGTVIATATISDGRYGYSPIFYIPDPDGVRSGSTISFFIDNVDTGETAQFTNGGYTKLDLTIPSPTLPPEIVAPTANPVAGTYTSTQNVILTAAGSSSIRYTTDGTTSPTCSSGTVYSGAISVNSSQTIKAIACYPDGASSSVSSFAYTINLPPNASPTASPIAGTYTSAQSVTLTATGASSIHYTIDGTVPTCTSGLVYSNPIIVTSTKTIKALSCYPNSNVSSVATFNYILSLVDGTTANVVLSSGTTGQAELPSGATTIKLSNSTNLDVSTSVSTASSGNINVGGITKPLNNFTIGNLSGVDLTASQNIGGQSLVVNKAVVLRSGVDTQPISLINNDLANVSVTIPDATTVLAPSGWDGKINPPKTGSSSGTAPSGFSVGGTVIEVGSATSILLFDKPVAIVLTGVTGNVGYKPAGSSVWVQITNVCGGTYNSPAAPNFPGECYISNGADTKIYTYHFTTFGSLSVISAPTPAPSGGVGGSPTPTYKTGDINKDNKVNKYDFALLMANWGKTGTNTADLNNDNKVDKYDFAILMANWSAV